MAPSALPPSPQPSDQDVDLTGSALQHLNQKLAAQQHLNGDNHDPNGTPATVPAELDASKLITTRTTSPRPVPSSAPAPNILETICTDHMVTASWSAAQGWSAPQLRPYGPLSLMPTASVLHYATECFEGLKAYRGHDGRLRLFRPDRNCARMRSSAVRVSLPSFPPAELQRLILALLEIDGPKWLPRDRPGSFLYLRPALIGTQAALGVQTPSEAMLFIVASYMPKFHELPTGMRLHTSPEDMVRAWVGGFGHAKLGANYGPSLLAAQEARARGFHQVLWLYGSEGFCTEAGASNFFVVWRTREGVLQLVTAPLDDRLILDGVTRRSVLELVRGRLEGEVEVVERRYTIDEVVEACAEGRMVESFAAGTAYFVSPVSLIHHRGKDYEIPMEETIGGKYTLQIRGWLEDIMYGREQHEWGIVVEEED